MNNEQKYKVKDKVTGEEVFFVDHPFRSAYEQAERFFNKDKNQELYMKRPGSYLFKDQSIWILIRSN